MADNDLICLAKDQLALPANAPVSLGCRLPGASRVSDVVLIYSVKDSVIPKCYLEELKLHLTLYPHDDNVRTQSFNIFNNRDLSISSFGSYCNPNMGVSPFAHRIFFYPL